MHVSVVVRSRDEAPRLRLTLASLARQTVDCEVIVVNDGSTDHTAAVLAEAEHDVELRVISHAVPRGRAGASNAGARAASGEVLLFLDGDTLAAPDMVERHANLHAAGGFRIGRGERFHLRSTRFLADPETAAPRPGEEGRLARMSAEERARLAVTRREVLDDFATIVARADRGVYPGVGPRLLQDIEVDALRHHPDCSVLWAAACGSNLSVSREAFLRVGGFNEAIDINEHRELALRLCIDGAGMTFIEGARDYHLTHRAGWRDPLLDTQWEQVFYAAHPRLAVKLLSVFWASLAPQTNIPREARINSLPELETAARGDNGIDYDAIRRLIGSLPELPPMREAASAAQRAVH
ncbi:MAG TPA: glycosyltransferase [Casimicrobiaceae bacterium]|nr:glycosyltransferase [Casimicrobiaceae bacterium]